MGLPAPAVPPVSGGQLLSRQGRRPSRNHYHQGTDWSEAPGLAGQTPALCIGLGMVRRTSRTGENHQYGNYVLVQHAQDMYSLYAHLDAIWVVEGQLVWSGYPLGLVGSTFGTPEDPGARMDVPHLHLEIVSSWPLSSRDAQHRYDVLRELAAAGVVLGGPDGRQLVAGEPIDYREPALASEGSGKGPRASDEVVVAPPELVDPRPSPSALGPVIVTVLSLGAVAIFLATAFLVGRKK